MKMTWSEKLMNTYWKNIMKIWLLVKAKYISFILDKETKRKLLINLKIISQNLDLKYHYYCSEFTEEDWSKACLKSDIIYL